MMEMGTVEHNPGMGKLQKNAKELEDMLRSALQQKHGASVTTSISVSFEQRLGSLFGLQR
jgi:hypothetical protein